jgi:hypothetical protein
VLEQDPDHGGLFPVDRGLGNTFDLFQCNNPRRLRRPNEDLAAATVSASAHRLRVETEDDLRDAYFALQSEGVAGGSCARSNHVSQKEHLLFHGSRQDTCSRSTGERANALEIFARARGDEDKPLTFS